MAIKKISFLILALFSVTFGKPQGDRIVFRDEESDIDIEDGLLTSKGTKVLGGENELVAQYKEHGKFFQGDIVLIKDQKDYLLADNSSGFLPTRTGLVDEDFRWPKDRNGKVILPYYIDPTSGFSNYQRQLLRASLSDIEYYTCIKFVERTNQEDFVFVHSGDGCSSNLGKIGGQQDISLAADGCFARGIIMHEFIHALGYDHMHSHAERDKFVNIKWENIKRDTVDNFETVDPYKFSNFGTPYDLYSVMHYDSTAFTSNGKDTIVPKNMRYKKVMGQRKSLSRGDANRINSMYKCNTKAY